MAKRATIPVKVIRPTPLSTYVVCGSITITAGSEVAVKEIAAKLTHIVDFSAQLIITDVE